MPLYYARTSEGVTSRRRERSGNNAGQFRIAYRLFPQNKNLPHRQDFCYVKWYN